MFFLIRCVLFIFLFQSILAYAAESDGVVNLSPPKMLPSFVLQSAEDKPITPTQFQQHWSLLFFGFTQCQMICPTTMLTLKQTYEMLEKQKKSLPQVVFVSIDSENDTSVLADRYAKSFNPHFVGLAGKEDQVALLTKSLGVLYMKVKQGNKNTIDHSANLFLVNPKGQVSAIFSPPYEPHALAKEIAKQMHAK